MKMNSPVRFHAIGSVEKLHLTTPGVVKKNDQVMAKVTTPISEPMADCSGLNAPAARSAARAYVLAVDLEPRFVAHLANKEGVGIVSCSQGPQPIVRHTIASDRYRCHQPATYLHKVIRQKPNRLLQWHVVI